MKTAPRVGDLVLETRRESVSAIGRVEVTGWPEVTVLDSGDAVVGVEEIADGVWQRRAEPGAIDLRSTRLVFRRPLGCA